MQDQKVRINLRYDRAELNDILLYVKAHDLERRGRYDFKTSPRLRIWTHPWNHAACRHDSCVMFSVEFDWKTSTLMSVELMPGFDWEGFVDELATLERAASGRSIYGRPRRAPTV